MSNIGRGGSGAAGVGATSSRRASKEVRQPLRLLYQQADMTLRVYENITLALYIRASEPSLKHPRGDILILDAPELRFIPHAPRPVES